MMLAAFEDINVSSLSHLIPFCCPELSQIHSQRVRIRLCRPPAEVDLQQQSAFLPETLPLRAVAQKLVSSCENEDTMFDTNIIKEVLTNL